MDANKGQIPARLAAAVTRAEAINLTLAVVMSRAGVSDATRSSVYRWANGAVSPKLGTFEAVMAAIEKQLVKEEDQLRWHLLGKRSAAKGEAA